MRFGAIGLALLLAACGGGGQEPRDGGRDVGQTPDGPAMDVPRADVLGDGGGDAVDASPMDAVDASPMDAVDAPMVDAADANITDAADAPQADAPDARMMDAPSADAPACLAERTLSVTASQAYAPLAVGNRWTYRGTVRLPGGSERTFNNRVVVTGTDVVGGKPVFVVTDSAANPNQPPATHYLEVASGGLVDHGEDVASSDPVAVPSSPVYTEIPFPITTCASYQQFSGVLPTGVTAASTATDRSFESRAVKVGSFSDTLRHERVIYAEPVTTTVVDWIAPGVGRVQRSVSQGTYAYAYELTGFLAGGVGRGVVQFDEISGTLHTEPVPLGPNRPAVASDGSRFLVVQATNTGFNQGGLHGIVVGADGKPISAAPLSSTASAPRDPAVAYGGGHYLVVYPEINQSTLWGMFVSPSGAPEAPRFPIGSGGTAASVTYGAGVFVVARAHPSALVIDVVNHQGQVVVETTPYMSMNTGSLDHAFGTAIATDDTNFLVAWATRVPDPNTSATIATHAAVARVDAQGRALDAAITTVSLETGVDESIDVAYDGSKYVVAWFHRPFSSFLGEGTIRAARVGRDGTLLDGPPSPAGGRALSFTDTTKDYPRIGRLGSTTVVVWESADVTAFDYRIVGTRLDAQGNPLDTSSTDEGLWIATPGFSRTPAIAFGGDRSLVVSVKLTNNYDWILGDTLLFPF